MNYITSATKGNAGIGIGALQVASTLAPLGYWLAMTIGAAIDGVGFSFRHAARELIVILGFGLPIAWLAALAWGFPVLVALRRAGVLSRWSGIAVGAAGGALVALAFAAAPHGDLFRVRMPFTLASALGAFCGGAWWWLRARTPRA